MMEGSDCGGIGGGCSDSARVVDSVSTNSAADAASDLIVVDIIVFLFGLWIIVSDVRKAVSRAITTVDGCDGGDVDKPRYFGSVHATPLMSNSIFLVSCCSIVLSNNFF